MQIAAYLLAILANHHKPFVLSSGPNRPKQDQTVIAVGWNPSSSAKSRT